MNSLFHKPHRPGYFFMVHPPSGFSKSSGFSSKAGKADAICEGKNWIQETMGNLQCEAPKIAKLVQITPITMVYATYDYSISPSNYSYKYHKP